MEIKTLYQTLEDRGNPDYVELNAPFKCNWKNTWLGDGYYYWDTFIENAHWWGQVRYANNYIICKAICDFQSEKCFDLVGNTKHMQDFYESIEFLRNQKLLNNNTTVARILTHLREKVKGFDYQAIRVYGINSISDKIEEYNKYRKRLVFEVTKTQYLDYRPAIQLCIFTKKGLNLRNLTIEYPDEYNQNCII